MMIKQFKIWVLGFLMNQINKSKSEGLQNVGRFIPENESYTNLSSKLIAYIDSYRLKDYEIEPSLFARYSVRDGLFRILWEYSVITDLKLRNYRKSQHPALLFTVLGVKFTLRPNYDYNIAIEARLDKYGENGLPNWLVVAFKKTDNLVQRCEYCTPVCGAMSADHLELVIDNIIMAANNHIKSSETMQIINYCTVPVSPKTKSNQ
jgi:hypothetical protein